MTTSQAPFNFEKKLLTRWVQRRLLQKNITLNSAEDLTPFHYKKLIESLTNKPILTNSTNSTESFDNLLEYLGGKEPVPQFEELLQKPDLHYKILLRLFRALERFSDGNYHDGKSAEDAFDSLLLWVQSRLSLEIYKNAVPKNFTTSWRDGLSICALIHQFNPRCIKFEKIVPTEYEANIRLAVYAANVLLNFGGLFSYENYILATENEMALLVYEFYNAFKISPKVGFSKEVTSVALDLFRDLEDNMSIVSKEEMHLNNHLNNLGKSLLLRSDYEKINAESAQRILEKTKSAESLQKSILDLEGKRFKTYKIALRLNSAYFMENISNQKKKASLVPAFNQIMQERCKLENKVFFRKNSAHIASQASKRHAELASELILWAQIIRKNLSTPAKSINLSEIVNEINCHRALNIEIKAKQGFYREELEKESDTLLKLKTKDSERAKNRVSINEMFEVVNKEWVKKLGELRTVENKIKADSKLKQHCYEYERIFESIKKREEEYINENTFSEEQIERMNLGEIKKQTSYLKLEWECKQTMNTSDLNRMDEIEGHIRKERKNCLEHRNFKESYFHEYNKKIEKLMDETVRSKEILYRKWVDILTRELYKERVYVMADTHKKISEKVVQWCKDEEKRISEDKITEFKNVIEAQKKIVELKTTEKLINYEIKSKTEFLNSISSKVMDANYSTAEFPSHFWRFEDSFEKREEFQNVKKRFLVSMADLSRVCQRQIENVMECAERLRKADDLRIQFSAAVMQFKQFAEDKSSVIKANLLSLRTAPEDVEPLKRGYLADVENFKNAAQILMQDVEKKYKDCERVNATEDISKKVLKELEEVRENFYSLLELSSRKFSEDSSKLVEKNNKGKNYAALVNDTMTYIQMGVANALSEKSLGVDAEVKKISESIENVKELEKELMEDEVNYIPYTAFKHSDVEQWGEFLISNLVEKKHIYRKFESEDRLSSISLMELEKIHKEHSKHFDSNHKAYMNKEAFENCMKSLEVLFSEQETKEIFDRNGVKSKKNPDMKLLGFKKFADLFCRIGSERKPQMLIQSFADLNNGLPFVSKEQLGTKLSLENINFLEKQIHALAKSKSEELFFRDWICGIYNGREEEKKPGEITNQKQLNFETPNRKDYELIDQNATGVNSAEEFGEVEMKN